MLKTLLFAVALISASLTASARDLVLAFDNCLQPSTGLDKLARAQMLAHNLNNAGVPQAMFLIQTKGLDARGRQVLGVYSDTGQLLVNAGHAHSLETRAELYAYEIGILKADRLLRRYSGYHKHIHFSYLNEFGDPVVQAGLKQFLHERKFKPTYLGVNPWRGADAYLDERYQLRVQNNRAINMSALQAAYVEFAVQMLNAQSEPAQLLLGYVPPQVLVLQETDLAAYFMPALVERLKALGWNIVAPEKVFADPLLNPVRANGYGGNGYLNALTWLPDERVVYPRLLGERKATMDNFIQAHAPELLE